MTNTKFRKRALLSSVAMLLVAILALGSATFAWFTSIPNANAQGLTLKATAEKGLVVMSSTAISNASKSKATAADWTHDEYLNCNSTRTGTQTSAVSIDAASTSQAATPAFFTTTASADDEEDADPTAAVSTGSPYHEELWCKVTGGDGSATSIKMTSLVINTAGSTAHALVPAFRVAIWYTDASGSQTFIGEYATGSKSTTHLTSTGASYTAASKETKSVSAAPSTDVSLGTCDDGGNCKLDIYCYLDGEDGACFTNNVDMNNIISSIQVNLAIA